MNQIQITWNEAQEQNKQAQERQTKKQAEALKNFLSESHEMTDARDLQYWKDATGKDVFWLCSNAEGLNPLLKNFLQTEGSIDDALNIDFHKRSQEIEEEDKDYEICFFVNRNTASHEVRPEPIYNYEIAEYTGLNFDDLTKSEQQQVIAEFNKS